METIRAIPAHHFQFKDFDEALRFVNYVGNIANETKHYPDLEIDYNRVKITFGKSDPDVIEAILKRLKTYTLEN